VPALIGAIVAAILEMPNLPRIILREIAAGGDSLPPDTMAEMGALLGLVRSVIDEGVRAGAFRPVDPVLTHFAILGTTIFMTATRPLRARMAEIGIDTAAPSSREELTAFLSALVLHGISATPEPGGSP
jgi:hypothetical protein